MRSVTMRSMTAATSIILLPLAALALDCRTVETDNKIEVVCEGESSTAKSKEKVAPKKSGKDESENLRIMDQLLRELDDLVRSDSKPESVKELLANARSISVATQAQCAEARLYTTEAHEKCLEAMKQINQGLAEIMVKSAELFAKNDMKPLARETYQEVIKTFKDDAYEFIVKQAQSGLQDLKEQ